MGRARKVITVLGLLMNISGIVILIVWRSLVRSLLTLPAYVGIAFFLLSYAMPLVRKALYDRYDTNEKRISIQEKPVIRWLYSDRIREREASAELENA